MAVMLTGWRNEEDDDRISEQLDSGIDDMEDGRELLIGEAFRRMSELREGCGNVRT